MKAARVAAALVCALLSTTMVAASAAAPTATAAATAPTPEARLKTLMASSMSRFNVSAAMHACLFSVRAASLPDAGAYADSSPATRLVGLATLDVIGDDDAPFTGWQEGRTVFGAVLFPNTTRTDARAAAQAICAHVPSRLPSLLGTRLGARATAAPVGTGIVTAVHDPRKGHPKRACKRLCSTACRWLKGRKVCSPLCSISCAICSILLPWC